MSQSSTQTTTGTRVVTQADVLYVNQQIIEDLRALRRAFPHQLSDEKILDIQKAWAHFMFNDACSVFGASIRDSGNSNLVIAGYEWHVTYTPTTQARSGVGGSSVFRPPTDRAVLARCSLATWVKWSPTMRSLSLEQQQQIVAGSGWGVPGAHSIDINYASDLVSAGQYRSGFLSVSAMRFG